MILTVPKFFIGLPLLFLGAELAVRGASTTALRLGVRPFVIGVTVVAVGTSLPEIIVSITASARAAGEIAIGNVVGSNIFGLTLVLGVAAVIHPIRIQMRLLTREVPLMIAISCLLFLITLNGILGRRDGVLLITGLALYSLFLRQSVPNESRTVESEYEDFLGSNSAVVGHTARVVSWLLPVLRTLLGLLLLWVSAHMVTSAVASTARFLGVSQLAIGLFIISLAAVLPELAVAVTAARKGESDVLVGTVVGANVLKILAGIGIAATVRPIAITGDVRVSIAVMFLLGFVLLPFAWTGRILSRVEGAILLVLGVLFPFLLVPLLSFV